MGHPTKRNTRVHPGSLEDRLNTAIGGRVPKISYVCVMSCSRGLVDVLDSIGADPPVFRCTYNAANIPGGGTMAMFAGFLCRIVLDYRVGNEGRRDSGSCTTSLKSCMIHRLVVGSRRGTVMEVFVAKSTVYISLQKYLILFSLSIFWQ